MSYEATLVVEGGEEESEALLALLPDTAVASVNLEAGLVRFIVSGDDATALRASIVAALDLRTPGVFKLAVVEAS